MDDYISREAAMNVANGWRDQLIPVYGKNDEYVKCLETVAEHLESLHAADVRPTMRGKWEDTMQSCHDSPHVKCSVCGEYYWRYFNKLNFCPNCGADMREES